MAERGPRKLGRGRSGRARGSTITLATPGVIGKVAEIVPEKTDPLQFSDPPSSPQKSLGATSNPDEQGSNNLPLASSTGKF